MFSQILKLVPRIEFERMVRQTGAEHAAKGFSSWSQFVAMLFCQLGRAHSLREIEGGLKSCEGKLAHLGIATPARIVHGSHSSRSSTGCTRRWTALTRRSCRSRSSGITGHLRSESAVIFS